MAESRTWFRLYTEFAFDPKVQLLDETLQRRYIMLLCAAAAGLSPFHAVSEAAFLLRIPVSECEQTRCTLVSHGLITDDWFPVAWDKRQFQSDTSTARVKRFRQRSKAVTQTVPETPSEQSRTEQRQSRAEHTQNAGARASPAIDQKATEGIRHDPLNGHDAFQRVKDAYPRFAGRQDWIPAQHSCHLRLDEGETWETLLAAVTRYALHIRAKGSEGTQFVLSPGKFFSAADRPWTQAWEIPASKQVPRAHARLPTIEEQVEQAIRDGHSDEQIALMEQFEFVADLRTLIRGKREEIHRAEH